MSNEAFVNSLAEEYKNMIENEYDEDYEINPMNWEKMIYTLNYLVKVAEKLGGKVEPVELIPKEKNGYIEAVFDVFDLCGNEIQEFTDIIKMANVFSIEPLADNKIRIGININEVYQKKII